MVDKITPKEKGDEGLKEQAVETTKDKKGQNFLSKLTDKYKSLRKRYKLMLWGGLFLVGLTAITLPLILILKLDSVIFPSTLEGKIYDYEESPIESARVCIADKCDESDSEGNYKLEGLTYGKNNVEVSIEGYETLEEEVTLRRGENTKDFDMKVAGRRDFKGMLQLKDTRDSVIEDGLILNLGDTSVDIKLHDDGSFELKNVEVGTEVVEIHSPNYKDIKVEIDVAQLEIDLGSHVLEPAGDVVFDCVDWLSAETLEGIKISGAIAGEQKNSVSYVQKGLDCSIEDLAPGIAVDLEVEKDGYLAKAIKVNSIKQGVNLQENFRMVPEGKLVYTSNKTGNVNIYLANYDGSEEIMLTDNKGNNQDPYYDKDKGVVYFVSDRDKEKNENDYVVNRVYKVEVTTKKITKVSKTDYSDNEGEIGEYNLQAGKRVYTKRLPEDDQYYYGNYTYEIYVGNIDGTDSKKVATSDRSLGSIYISNDGRYIMYRKYSDKAEVYLVNTSSGSSTMIYQSEKGSDWVDVFGFSPDSRNGLIKVYSSSESQSDVWVRDFSLGKLIQITNTKVTESAASYLADSSTVSYVRNVDGKYNIFVVGDDGEGEKEVTTEGSSYSYANVDGMIYWESDDQLKVVNPFKPERTQVVNIKGSLAGLQYSDYYYYD